jgi:hypothetical protein
MEDHPPDRQRIEIFAWEKHCPSGFETSEHVLHSGPSAEDWRSWSLETKRGDVATIVHSDWNTVSLSLLLCSPFTGSPLLLYTPFLLLVNT